MSKTPAIRAYLGPENGLRNETLAELRAFIKKQTGGPAEEHRLYIPDDSLDDAFEILESGSLFGDHRLVLVNGAEQIRKKADVQRVADYVKRSPEGATLVLISEAARLDSKLEKTIPGDSRKVFWELFENQKRGWVQGHFRKRNVPITAEALELFLDLVENNTQELGIEADKLIVYFQSRAEKNDDAPAAIGVDEVESFVYHSRDENVFSLHRKLVDGDFDGALEVLAKIEGSGEANPAQLIGGLAFQTRRLIALRSLLDNGFSQDEAFKRLNIRGKRIQSDYRDSIARFGSTELRRQMVQLVQFEAATREHGNAIQPLLLELLVYRLVFPGEDLLGSDERALA